jgi:hypothetical protein
MCFPWFAVRRLLPKTRLAKGSLSNRRLHVHVGCWHLADVPLALTNVCFEGDCVAKLH